MEEFGFSPLEHSIDDFQKKDSVIQSGVSWEQAEATKESGKYGKVPVFFIGKDQYIENKRAIGRAIDIADIEALGEDD